MFSRYPGPHEGSYTVNPKHMKVNKPCNTNDDDLKDRVRTVNRPLSQPTSMSYFLQRVKLAELCRGFTDSASSVDAGLNGAVHSQILEIDAAIEKFVNEMPRFFCLNPDRADGCNNLDTQRAPGIIIQRYILNSLVHAQRCKLHVQLLAQGFADPAYAHSREKCLDAARTIIRTERLLSMENIPFVLIRLKFSGVLYCVFRAIIVLLLDVCLNKGASDEELRKAEVVQAFSVLEEARSQSTMATKLLESLMSVVRKHRVILPEPIRTSLQEGRLPAAAQNIGFSGTATTSERSGMGEIGETDTQKLSLDLSYFDDIWQSFDCEMDIGPLFSALTAEVRDV